MSTSFSAKSANASTQSKLSSRASTPPSSSAKTLKSNKPDLSKVLGPDGKLLPEEKERRKQNDLCMVCGDKGHFADKCLQHKEAAQAHAVTLDDIEESEDSSSGAESSASQN